MTLFSTSGLPGSDQKEDLVKCVKCMVTFGVESIFKGESGSILLGPPQAPKLLLPL
jgi:hypothetical protein